MKREFDASELTDTFIRCFLNQLKLMERCYLDGNIDKNRCGQGIREFHKAMVIINSELYMHGYNTMDIFWFTTKEGEA